MRTSQNVPSRISNEVFSGSGGGSASAAAEMSTPCRIGFGAGASGATGVVCEGGMIGGSGMIGSLVGHNGGGGCGLAASVAIEMAGDAVTAASGSGGVGAANVISVFRDGKGAGAKPTGFSSRAWPGGGPACRSREISNWSRSTRRLSSSI